MILPISSVRHYFSAIRKICRRSILLSDWHCLVIPLRTVTKLFLYNLVRNRQGIVCRTVVDQPMFLDLEDRGLSEELLIYGIHEPFLTALTLNEVRPDDIIIEVGANIGYYVLKEGRLLGKKGKVVAIEPDPRNQKLLSLNIKQNKLSEKVSIIHAAVGPTNGFARLELKNARNISSIECILTTTSSSKVIDVIEVPTFTLDQLLKDEAKIDIIRMDIEGYEFEAIKGMVGALSKFKPRALLFELHPIDDYTSMLNFCESIASLGYTADVVIPRHFVDGVLCAPEQLITPAVQLLGGRNIPLTRYFGDSKRATVEVRDLASLLMSSQSVFHVLFRNPEST